MASRGFADTPATDNVHPRIEELITYIADRRRDLRAAAESVPRDLWSITPAENRWSVADVLEHLFVVEQRIAALLEKNIAEAKQAGLAHETNESSQIEGMRLNRYVDRTAKIVSRTPLPRAGRSPDAALDALNQSRAVLTTAIQSGDGFALGTLSAPHPAFGPMNFYEWIGFVGAHEGRHAAQIREIGEAFA